MGVLALPDVAGHTRLALLGVASWLGWTYDSRDSAYSLGPILPSR